MFIKNHVKEFPVEKMCKVLKVSQSGYYKWLKRTPSKRTLRQTMLIKEIQSVYRLSKGRYGSPRITKELNMAGIKVSKVLVICEALLERNTRLQLIHLINIQWWTMS